MATLSPILPQGSAGAENGHFSGEVEHADTRRPTCPERHQKPKVRALEKVAHILDSCWNTCGVSLESAKVSEQEQFPLRFTRRANLKAIRSLRQGNLRGELVTVDWLAFILALWSAYGGRAG